ncbi:MAG: hypothetical protein ACI3XA_02280 [Clostridia bacterium]
MKKMLISVLMVLILLFSVSISALAHPLTIAEGTRSTVSNLITIKKPDTQSTSTVKTTYSVTGVGKEGVSVCFYVFDGEKYVARTNAQGAVESFKIGSSGVFYRQIALSEGQNRICVRAESPDGNYQLAYLSISVIKNGVMSDINSFSFNMQSKLNGWLN